VKYTFHCDAASPSADATSRGDISSHCRGQYNVTQLQKKTVAHTRLPIVGFRIWFRFLVVSLQVTWVINPAVGCHYLPPGSQLPSQPPRGLLSIRCLVNRGTMGVNTEQFAQDCYPTASRLRFNPGRSAPESSTLTTRLPSYPTQLKNSPIILIVWSASLEAWLSATSTTVASAASRTRTSIAVCDFPSNQLGLRIWLVCPSQTLSVTQSHARDPQRSTHTVQCNLRLVRRYLLF